jgi:hypothetical protein
MAVISLDFSATVCGANPQRACPANTLTRCTAGFSPSRYPGEQLLSTLHIARLARLPWMEKISLDLAFWNEIFFKEFD